MITPIFIDNNGDMIVFASVADAESWLEAFDIQNGEYEAFDAEGKFLRLTVAGETVRIVPADNEPSHADEFRKKLQVFLQTAKVPNVYEDASLSQLVSVANQFVVKSNPIKGFLSRIFKRTARDQPMH